MYDIIILFITFHIIFIIDVVKIYNILWVNYIIIFFRLSVPYSPWSNFLREYLLIQKDWIWSPERSTENIKVMLLLIAIVEEFLYCSFVSLITKLTRALHEETNWNIKCCLDITVKGNSENEYKEMIYLIKSASWAIRKWRLSVIFL